MSTFQKYVGYWGTVIAGTAGVVTAIYSAFKYHNNIEISKYALTGIVFNFICSIVLFYLAVCSQSVMLTFPNVWRPELRIVIILCIVQVISSILIVASKPRYDTNDPKALQYQKAENEVKAAEKYYNEALEVFNKTDPSNSNYETIKEAADTRKSALSKAKENLGNIQLVTPAFDPLQYVSIALNSIIVVVLISTLNNETVESIMAVGKLQQTSLKG